MINSEKIIIDVIIVNWNGRDYLKKAIEPLFNRESELIDLNIIISDNGSTDNSLDQVKHLPISIIHNGRNIGFGAACNQAYHKCRGKYLLLLNPDTESTIDVIEKLVLKIEQLPEYGVIGPGQNDRTGNIQRTCGRFPTFSTSIWELIGLSKIFPKIFKPVPIMFDWDHDSSSQVDHIMGSYMLIRRSILEKIGFMDDHYFVYLEDIDLSKRINESGFRSYYYHEAVISHEGGGLSKQEMGKRLYFSLSSKLYYWHKHFSRPSSFILKFMALTIEPSMRMLKTLITLNPKASCQICKAYYYLYREVILGMKTN